VELFVTLSELYTILIRITSRNNMIPRYLNLQELIHLSLQLRAPIFLEVMHLLARM
jgi:hypothetical protein